MHRTPSDLARREALREACALLRDADERISSGDPTCGESLVKAGQALEKSNSSFPPAEGAHTVPESGIGSGTARKASLREAALEHFRALLSKFTEQRR